MYIQGEEPIILDLKETERKEAGQYQLGEEWRDLAKEEIMIAKNGKMDIAPLN